MILVNLIWMRGAHAQLATNLSLVIQTQCVFI
jgi:hypothetical protein